MTIEFVENSYFNKDTGKQIIEDIFKSLFRNSIMTAVLRKHFPGGFDPSKLGKLTIGKVLQKSSYWARSGNNYGPMPNINEFSRTYKDNDTSLTIRLHRSMDWPSGTKPTIDKKTYRIIIILFFDCLKTSAVASQFREVMTLSKLLQYDESVPFSDFIENGLIASINNPGVTISENFQETYDHRMQTLNNLVTQVGKYL